MFENGRAVEACSLIILPASSTQGLIGDVDGGDDGGSAAEAAAARFGSVLDLCDQAVRFREVRAVDPSAGPSLSLACCQAQSWRFADTPIEAAL